MSVSLPRKLFTGALTFALVATLLVVVPSHPVQARDGEAHSRAQLVDGDLLGVDAEDLIELSAQASFDGSQSPPVTDAGTDLTALQALSVTLGPLPLFGDGGILTLGALNQYAEADAGGYSRAASGNVDNDGLLAGPGPGGEGARIRLIAEDLGLGDVLDLEISAGLIAAFAEWDASNPAHPIGTHHLTDLEITVGGALIEEFAEDVDDVVEPMVDTLNGLLDVLGLDAITVTNPLASGVVVIDEDTLTAVSPWDDLNEAPPGTDLLEFLPQAIALVVDDLLQDVIDTLEDAVDTILAGDLGLIGILCILGSLSLPLIDDVCDVLADLPGVLGDLLSEVADDLDGLVSALAIEIGDVLGGMARVAIGTETTHADGSFQKSALSVELLNGDTGTLSVEQLSGGAGTLSLANAIVGANQGPLSDLPPFVCDGMAYLFQGSPTSAFGIDLVTGDATELAADFYPTNLNAQGYNVADDYIYGWHWPPATSQGLARIGADFAVEVLGFPPNWSDFPVLDGIGIQSGDFDADGNYWVVDGRAGEAPFRWAQIDLQPGSGTYFEVVAAGAAPAPTAGFGFADWGFNPVDGHLYTVASSGTERQLWRFDTSSGDLDLLTPLGSFGSGGFGAMYTDADGYLYASDNNDGAIWRIDMAGPYDVEQFAHGPSSSLNDGARCFTQPVLADFGDAPDTYGTTLAADGARHSLPDYDPDTHTAPLMLGELVDAEPDGIPTPGADGDDNDGIDDEDGVADPIVFVPGEPTEVNVAVTNDTDEPATLAGWLDRHGTGSFDTGDRADLATIPAATTGTFTLTFPPGTATENTYARFRLFAGEVADPQPTGPAAGGEVEDHLVNVSGHEVVKTSDPGSGTHVAPGDTVTYTLTITNTGGVHLEGIEVFDDLSGVLDDALLTSGPEVQPPGAGTATITDTELAAAVDVDVGEAVTITYTVTVQDPGDTDGDGVLDNVVTSPGAMNCPDPAATDPDDPAFDPDCTTTHPVESYTIVKSSQPAGPVEPGDVVSYTLTLTNTGGAELAEAITDDLSDVLDDASYNDDATASSGEVSVAGDELTWTGDIPVGGTTTIEYSVTVNEVDDLGDGNLGNVVTGTGTNPCPDPDCETATPVEAILVEKMVSDPDAVELQPGDGFTYTVTVTNVGGVDITDAEVTDDLSGVLDDATFDVGSETADIGVVTYDAPMLTWVGDLTVGASATITYSVTISDPITGDGVLHNTVVGGTNCPDGSPDPRCSTQVPQPILETVKSVSTTDPMPGDTVSYEILISNVGEGPAFGATLSDDLSGVLDDATFDVGSETADIGVVTYDAPMLTWVGDLAVGASATITYTVTVNDADDLGDGVLVNAVTGGGCPDPAVTDPDEPGFDPDCVTVHEVEAWLATKTADVDGPVGPGDTVGYTITVVNTGGTDLSGLTVSDDLSGVLDDATFDADHTATVGVVVFDEPTLTWTGDLPAGTTAVITYTVTVNDADALGDGQLVNTIVGTPNCPDPAVTDPDEPGFDPDCVERNDIAAYTIAKSTDAPDPVAPGDVVTYRVEVSNTGGTDLVGDATAVFVDDLTGVLDDAAYNHDATADVGAVTYDEPSITWSGDLGVGDSATVTYSVTIADPIVGDFVLVNVVTGGDCPDPAITDPDDLSFDPDCVSIVELPGIHYHKAIAGTAVDELNPGDTYTYQVVVTNTGQKDLVGQTFVDDLSDVLDDAVYNDDATADIGEVTYDAPMLTWTANLAVGQSATVTYTVTIDDPVTGDGILRNLVVGDGPNSNCPEGSSDPDCFTAFPEQVVEVGKELVGPDQPEPGDTVTYRLWAHNRGGATAEQELMVDDLTGVLDTAAYNDDAAPSHGTANYNEPQLSWRVDIAPGQTVELVYSVTVNDLDHLGDARLVNTISGGINCPSDRENCSTDHPIAVVVYDKTILDPVDGQAEPSDQVTYRITVINRGSVALVGLTFSDDLTDLLAHATWLGDVHADRGRVEDDPPTLSWSGDLQPGEMATVTYAVTLHQEVPSQTEIRNIVIGEGPGSNCLAGSRDPACTTDLEVDQPTPPAHPTTPGPLPRTGIELARMLGLALAASVTGGALVARQRRDAVRPSQQGRRNYQS